jgi:hypothetical protein
MPSKHFIDDCASSVDGPRRPWRWRCCSGASKGGHYIGTYGGPPMSPPRHPDNKAKAPRSLIAVSIRLVQRYARARRRARATVQKPFQRRGEVIKQQTIAVQRSKSSSALRAERPRSNGVGVLISHRAPISRFPAVLLIIDYCGRIRDPRTRTAQKRAPAPASQ